MRHSKLACSASHRWIACPGSIKLCESVPPRPESEHAIEGTAAHALAEWCLNENKEPNAYPYASIMINDKRAVIIDDEMRESVQEYVDEIRAQITENSIVNIEKTFKLDWLFPNSGGTSDANILNKEIKKLYVNDLKYGKGIVVEPEWNSQLMMYALGALHEMITMHRADTVKDKPIEK